MSLDYPDRKVWLAKRYTPRGLKHEKMIRPMPGAPGGIKDPGLFHAHRRWKGMVIAKRNPEGWSGFRSYSDHDYETTLRLNKRAIGTWAP